MSFANVFLSLGKAWGEMFDHNLMVSVDDHEIRFKYEKEPEEIEGINWDNNMYVNGNIYYKGKANPIKPVIDDGKDEVELISSDRYKDFMKQTLVRDIVRATEDEGLTMTQMLVIGSLAVSALTLIAVLMVSGGA